MDFNSNARMNQGQVLRGGDGGRGGGVAIGGVGAVVLAIIAMFFGINPSSVLGGSGQPEEQPTASKCSTGADIAKDPECRWDAYVTSINDFWDSQINGYRPAQTRIFSSGSIATGCGTASRDMGPFYCPPDEMVYIDTQFADALLKQLGARGGYAAEAYIVAHEYGHHVSNLTGQMPRGQAAKATGPTSPGVRLELQADCYAGVWFKNASQDRNNIIQNITTDDLDRIVDAAAAVGDDHIQKANTGRIHPEQWTHGSSKMRQKWVKRGFDSGNPKSCDAFSASPSELGA